MSCGQIVHVKVMRENFQDIRREYTFSSVKLYSHKVSVQVCSSLKGSKLVPKLNTSILLGILKIKYLSF